MYIIEWIIMSIIDNLASFLEGEKTWSTIKLNHCNPTNKEKLKNGTFIVMNEHIVD